MFFKIQLFYRRHYLITALIISLLSLLVAFVLLELAIKPEGGARGHFAVITLQAVLTAIIIGVVISILEKLASVEKTKALADEIDARLKDTLNLKLVHGFHLIHESADEIDKINQMETGDIKWSNTVIRNHDRTWNAITTALERGRYSSRRRS